MFIPADYEEKRVTSNIHNKFYYDYLVYAKNFDPGLNWTKWDDARSYWKIMVSWDSTFPITCTKAGWTPFRNNSRYVSPLRLPCKNVANYVISTNTRPNITFLRRLVFPETHTQRFPIVKWTIIRKLMSINSLYYC